MLNLVASHPLLDAGGLVLGAFLIERLFLIMCGSVAAMFYGPYRGQRLDVIERVGIFVTALALMIFPVILYALR